MFHVQLDTGTENIKLQMCLPPHLNYALHSYFIFVTNPTNISVERKIVMWRNFKFLCMTYVENSEFFPRVFKFPHMTDVDSTLWRNLHILHCKPLCTTFAKHHVLSSIQFHFNRGRSFKTFSTEWSFSDYLVSVLLSLPKATIFILLRKIVTVFVI